MVRINDELLRGPRTGIAPEAGSLLRAIASGRTGIRGPYEADGDIGALARVCLHLMARIEDLEGRQAVSAPEEPTARSLARAAALPPPKDVRAWKPAPTEEKRQEEPERRSAAGAQQRADLIDEVLSQTPGRWWTAKELSVHLIGRGWPGKLSPVAVSDTLMRSWLARGWDRRTHPMRPNRRQYSGPVEATVPGGGQ